MPVGWGFANRGWAMCDGQLLPISSNSALFSLLGTTFGGDGRTTFALPDLRGRSIVHIGSGPGLSNIRWGERGGAEQVSLTIANLPPHNHTLRAGGDANLVDTATGSVLASDSRGGGDVPEIYTTDQASMSMGNTAITNTGGGQSFNNRNPYLGIYVLIALQGLYPSRS